MKNVLLILLPMLVIVASCKKNEEEAEEIPTNIYECELFYRELNTGTIQRESDNISILTIISEATEYEDKWEFVFDLNTSGQDLAGDYIFSESDDPYTFTASRVVHINSSSGSSIIVGTSTTSYSSGSLSIGQSDRTYEITFQLGSCTGYFEGSLKIVY